MAHGLIGSGQLPAMKLDSSRLLVKRLILERAALTVRPVAGPACECVDLRRGWSD
jgi:hypothetical protein